MVPSNTVKEGGEGEGVTTGRERETRYCNVSQVIACGRDDNRSKKK